jgi:hypothetical protein
LTVGATNGYPVIDFENSNTAYGDVGFQVDKMVLSAYTTTPLTFWTNSNERVRITSAGNVGIGTDAPAAKLQTTGTDAASVITGIALENFIATNPSSGNGVAVDFRLNNSGNTSAVAGKISTVNTFFRSNTDMVFSTFTSDALTEKVRIQSGGGISFNGDTAAANALDDYEEGTFTPALTAGTSAPTGVTYAYNGGRYTKIGRLVNITLGFLLSSKGTGGSGAVRISGLPFTAPVYGAYQEPNARLIGGAFSTTSIASSAYAFVTGSSTFIEGRVGQNVDTALDYGEITDSTYLSFNLTYYI